MLLKETELRTVVRKVILHGQSNLDAKRLFRENIADVKDFISTLEDEIDELEEVLEDPPDDEEELEDVINNAEQAVEAIEEAFCRKYGLLYESPRKRKLLNEGGGLILGISIALAAPKVIELIVAGVAKLIGDEGPAHDLVHSDDHDHDEDDDHHDEYANKYLNAVNNFAHKIHGSYIKAIEKVLRLGFKAKLLIQKGKTLFMSKEKKEKYLAQLEKEKQVFESKIEVFSERVLLVIIAIFAIISGKGAIMALGKGHGGLALLETGLGAIKTYEIGPLAKALGENATAIVTAMMA